MKAILSCGLVGIVYGGAFGSLLGATYALAGLFQTEGAIRWWSDPLVLLLCFLAINAGLGLGAFVGLITGVIGGISGHPGGWSLGAVIGWLATLDTFAIIQGGRYGPTQRPLDALSASSIIGCVIILGLVGAIMGLAVYRARPRLPMVSWLRKRVKDSAMANWTWPARVMLILVIALPVTALAIHCPHDYSTSIGNFPDDTIAERAVMQRMSTIMLRCRHAVRYSVEWSVDGTGQGGVVPYTLVYERRKRTLKDYWDAPAPGNDPLWTLSDVNLADIHAAAGKSGDFKTLKKLIKQKHQAR